MIVSLSYLKKNYIPCGIKIKILYKTRVLKDWVEKFIWIGKLTYRSSKYKCQEVSRTHRKKQRPTNYQGSFLKFGAEETVTH